MSDLRDQIISSVDIAVVAGRYTALQKAGRELRGRCPMHEEKTASFYVNPDKHVCHCHSCKGGGNVIDLVMAVEKLDFVDAMELLARQFGIQATGGQGRARGQRTYLSTINDGAAKFFEASLRAPDGEHARTYLRERGISDELVASFGLGYAPRAWDALTGALLSRGAKGDDVLKLGLIARKSGRDYYDFFRHRLIFPLRNVTGATVGFAGRALAAEDNPKYLNIANSPLYDKSGFLYNLDRAKNTAQEGGIIITEGYVDVIALTSIGTPNTVATCGTAMTPEHVKLMQRYADDFYLAYDGDNAGLEATWKSGLLILTAGFMPRVVRLPDRMDPGDLLQAKEPQAMWSAALSNAQPLMRWWLDRQLYRKKERPTGIEIRRMLTTLAPVFGRLPDEISKLDFIQVLADRSRIAADELRELLEVKQRNQRQRGGRPELGAVPRLEREAINGMLLDEELRFGYCLLADPAWFTTPEYRDIFRKLQEGASTSTILAEHGQLIASGPAELAHDVPPELILNQHYQTMLKRTMNVSQ